MNKVMLVGRLTRDPELRSLPSGKHVATFTMAVSTKAALGVLGRLACVWWAARG